MVLFNDLITLNTVQVRSHFKSGGDSLRGVQNTMARMASRHIPKYSCEAQSAGLGRKMVERLWKTVCKFLSKLYIFNTAGRNINWYSQFAGKTV